MTNAKLKLIVVVLGIFVICVLWRTFFETKVIASELQNFDSQENNVLIVDGGLSFEVNSDAKDVSGLLQEQGVAVSEHDLIYPSIEEKMRSGMRVIIHRAKKIAVKEGGKTKQVHTLQDSVEEMIWENKDIVLDEDDITSPARNMPIKDGSTVTVTHVLIKEEVKNTDIAFKTISNEDDKLGWRIKKITQKGEVGTKETKYKVVYNDGKEISRKVLETNVIEKPVDEVVTQGTFVKTGKGSRGDASYYASSWGSLNASRSIPRGGYAKVTNMDNGKSVIVKINDYGPQSPQRIIDLDYASFSKIADLGQGIAHNVKVEQVLN